MKKNIVIFLFVFVIGVFGFMFFNQAQEMKAMNETVLMLQSENESLKAAVLENETNKEVIKDLETSVKQLTDNLKAKEEEIQQYEVLKEVFEIEEMTDQDLLNAKDISMGTPLDLEASLSVVKYANHYEIKPSLLLSMIELESNFSQYEVGGAQDRGYLQIIPGTEKWLAEAFGSKLGLDYDPNKIFEPDYNIGLAASYIAFLRDAYGENYSRILSEYNRGPYNLAKYYAEYQTYSTSYSRVILNKESKYLVYND